jgi:hypothetical protein
VYLSAVLGREFFFGMKYIFPKYIDQERKENEKTVYLRIGD